ncbi:hypothetical protein [Catenulispora subtropica]|uniref:Uncharacterized protein n=1 Tax=Catenulispora subtropica TaxID=450798 RepID=A0ABP5CDX9_9ACTN
MAETRDRQHNPGPGAARVEISEVSELIQAAADLIHARTAPASAVLAFHERKAALFEALAAEEPENVDRQEAAKSSRDQVEYLRAMAERGCS